MSKGQKHEQRTMSKPCKGQNSKHDKPHAYIVFQCSFAWCWDPGIKLSDWYQNEILSLLSKFEYETGIKFGNYCHILKLVSNCERLASTFETCSILKYQSTYSIHRSKLWSNRNRIATITKPITEPEHQF